MGCHWFRTLNGELETDWGVCANARSPRVGLLTLEHVGCEEFEHDPRYDYVSTRAGTRALRRFQEAAIKIRGKAYMQVVFRKLRERLDGAGLGPEIKSEHDPDTRADKVGSSEAAPTAVPEGREEAAAPTVHDVLLAVRRALDQARAHVQGATMAAFDAYSIETLYRVLEERLAALEPGRGVSTEQ